MICCCPCNIFLCADRSFATIYPDRNKRFSPHPVLLSFVPGFKSICTLLISKCITFSQKVVFIAQVVEIYAPLLGEEVVGVMDMIYLTHPVVADILFVISTKVFVTSLLGWKRMMGNPASCEENKASAAVGIIPMISCPNAVLN